MQDLPPPHRRFFSICRRNSISLSDSQLTAFQKYADLLLEWNKKINLISRRDEEHLWERHILHSVSLAFHVNLPPSADLLDLGSGGGLPGIPLKILYPHLRITLLDSIQKKVLALQDIIRQLSLEETTAVWARVEDFAKQVPNKHSFDIVVARGVAPLYQLIQWSRPLLRQQGEITRIASRNDRIELHPPVLIAYKGGDVESEIRKARQLVDAESISTIKLRFNGEEDLPLVDKRIVIVSF
ncbi:MAG TPA: 16S rRNA (guanine(527)-N(7))-methyltransferase RsmG [Bacteroidota bacterium]|nr:16S rRNA (guanine(527)-N(7))-methyltransferase RsmG [Bacteroidota bacterium]